MRVTARTGRHRATSRAAVLRQHREHTGRLIERIAHLEAELAAERARQAEPVEVIKLVPVAVPASHKAYSQLLTATSVPQLIALSR